jgi:hypothetical protein
MNRYPPTQQVQYNNDVSNQKTINTPVEYNAQQTAQGPVTNPFAVPQRAQTA